MKYVNQHNAVSCLPTALYMINDNKGLKTITNYCRKHFNYCVTKRHGCTASGEMVAEFLQSLGHDAYTMKKGSFKSLAGATKYNKAVIMIWDTSDGYAHAMAWDGAKVYDPAFAYDGPYAERAIYRNYRNTVSPVYFIICVKTPLLQRLANVFKYEYHNVGYILNRIMYNVT